MHRFRFFGRDSVSLLLLLPIALPGIITGLALQQFFTFANQQASWLPGLPFSILRVWFRAGIAA